ncbi:BRCA1-associated protein [Stomoxys calcitrans]|uniref:BRCA1-associated protein n=1 Tax=Stomoxys calcitrans TaxID=35570 RepID=A0A1I8NZ06_STOCA|nr:BRCA1-associated protein [Stomoxys calcitrans]
MLENISLCVIKIEIDSTTSEESDEAGAVSSEHPNNPRVLKERERDRGLRKSSQIIIETYSNKLWSEVVAGEEMASTKEKKATVPLTSEKRQREFPTSSSSRETTPLEEGQCASELPKEIGFFSGNPSVEITNGIIHLYKKNERKEIKDAPSNQLCLLAVPASLSCHDLLSFVAPCHTEIQHIRIVRDGCPNQFMVLLEFRSNSSALEFYQTYNGAAYNSLEPDSLCHAVWVSEVEKGEDGLPPLGHTELPTCPVCLERMDESVDGVLTILCNHAFHANCLIKWGDSTCPVCRHVQTPEFMENSVCMECEGTDSLWICLICGHVGCGRYQGGHAAAHYRATNHTFAMQLGTSSVWDYAGDNFVHRLFQNKTDGKLVATQAPNDEGEEKIDSIQLEFTYLLTSQLDTQRKYYEERMEHLEKEWHDFRSTLEGAHSKMSEMEQRIQTLNKEKQALERKLQQNNTKLKEIQKQLVEEQEISRALQTNQSSWHSKYKQLDQQYKAYRDSKEAELSSIKEQLHDIMFYMTAQSKIAESELKEEIAGGTVVLPDEPTATSSSTSKGNRRKKKH